MVNRSGEHEVPEGPRSTRRRSGLLGILAGLVTCALVAVPMVYAAMFAVAGYTGCFLECSEPEPLVGLMWTGVTILLLALPVVTGVVAARVRTLGGWVAVAIVVVVLIIGYQALQGVV